MAVAAAELLLEVAVSAAVGQAALEGVVALLAPPAHPAEVALARGRHARAVAGAGRVRAMLYKMGGGQSEGNLAGPVAVVTARPPAAVTTFGIPSLHDWTVRGPRRPPSNYSWS